ncbi:DUF6233 domain-containing protein [Actinacidiphila epipremni]|uniref:Uncharacterized protein n=1 Tax=Actinacidiphila epipremni TaxID=2053013 RepID=A0ABX0ZUU6_9ACTN|nr:DUF6233 domain-containing protein [Actinacidiphila epipremni]NJP47795.1 hypothetical protein [Actinacidiphila epipremni]
MHLGDVRAERTQPRLRDGGAGRFHRLGGFTGQQGQVRLRTEQGQDRLVDRHRVLRARAARAQGGTTHLALRPAQRTRRSVQPQLGQQPQPLPAASVPAEHHVLGDTQIRQRTAVRGSAGLLAPGRCRLRGVPVGQVRSGRALDLVGGGDLHHPQHFQHVLAQGVGRPGRIAPASLCEPIDGQPYDQVPTKRPGVTPVWKVEEKVYFGTERGPARVVHRGDCRAARDLARPASTEQARAVLTACRFPVIPLCRQWCSDM